MRSERVLAAVAWLAWLAPVRAQAGGAPSAAADLYETYTERARVAFERRDFEAAIQALEAALLARPGDGLALRRLGVAHLARGETDAAETALTEAARRLPDDPMVWGYLAGVAERRGDLARATHQLERAVRLDPARQELWHNLALAWCRLREWDRAGRALDRARAAGAAGAAWTRLRARVLIEAGQWDEARALLEELEQADQTTADRQARALVLGQVGRWPEAAALLAQLWEESARSDAELLRAAVRACLLANDSRRAAAMLEPVRDPLDEPLAAVRAILAQGGDPDPALLDPGAFCAQPSGWLPWVLREMLAVGRAERLRVEVDAQQGCQPSSEVLGAVEALLRECTGAGLEIEIAVDPLLPLTKVEADPSAAFAGSVGHLPEDAPGTAYLRLVFFDGGEGLVSLADTPFPAVYINVAEGGAAIPWVRRQSWVAGRVCHLVGHALGLPDAVGAHAPECLMRPGAWLAYPGGCPRLCAACRAEARQPPVPAGQVLPPVQFACRDGTIVRTTPRVQVEIGPDRIFLRSDPGAELAVLDDAQWQVRLAGVEVLTGLAAAPGGGSIGAARLADALRARLGDPAPEVAAAARAALDQLAGAGAATAPVPDAPADGAAPAPRSP